MLNILFLSPAVAVAALFIISMVLSFASYRTSSVFFGLGALIAAIALGVEFILFCMSDVVPGWVFLVDIVAIIVFFVPAAFLLGASIKKSHKATE